MNEVSVSKEIKEHRTANYDIAPILLNRWSPRAMTGESLSDEELYPLFEAARWAPSSSNAQPWRFIIARRENSAEFEKFVNLMVPANQIWAKNAAALVVVTSRTHFEHNEKPSVTHQFDTGAAWENLALEATHRGLVTHGMAGFDYARAKTELGVPGNFEVHAMIAIGRRGKLEDLPEDYRPREKPAPRRPLNEILFEGAFGKSISNLK